MIGEDERMSELTEGTFLRWIDPQPGQKPLGVVITPPSGGDETTIYVLMADRDGTTDVEVFLGRPDATGVSASDFVLESMEVVEDGDPELKALLGQIGPNWWHISAHLEGGHAEQLDADCLLCREADQTA